MSGRSQVATGMVVGYAAGGPFQGLTNLPYTATRKITTVQKLTNGTTITRTTTSKEARDSQGRTMTESKPLVMGDFAPEVDLTHVTVMDPVAHTWTSWSRQVKQATVMHIPEPRQIASGAHSPAQPVMIGVAETASGGTPVIRSTPSQPGNRREFHTEKLGGKLVGNVYAEGVRTTTTIPTGMAGNDQPLVTVSETWTSPDLKLVVLNTTDDPRTGLRSEEIKDLNRNEPDPSVFQVPAGYAVKEPGVNQP